MCVFVSRFEVPELSEFAMVVSEFLFGEVESAENTDYQNQEQQEGEYHDHPVQPTQRVLVEVDVVGPEVHGVQDYPDQFEEKAGGLGLVREPNKGGRCVC